MSVWDVMTQTACLSGLNMSCGPLWLVNLQSIATAGGPPSGLFEGILGRSRLVPASWRKARDFYGWNSHECFGWGIWLYGAVELAYQWESFENSIKACRTHIRILFKALVYFKQIWRTNGHFEQNLVRTKSISVFRNSLSLWILWKTLLSCHWSMCSATPHSLMLKPFKPIFFWPY